MKRRGAVIAGLIALAVVVGIAAVALRPEEGEAAYVTATASRGTIAQTLTLVGPVERDNQAEVEFTSPGVVTAVNVRVGDHVSAGTPLATLDDTSLRLAVLQARADVAQSEAQLDADLAARKNGSTSTPVATPAANGSGGTAATPDATAAATPSAGAMPDALTAMSAAVAAVQAALAAQQAVCGPLFGAAGSLGGLLPTSLPTTHPTIPWSPPTASEAPTASPTPSPTATGASGAKPSGPVPTPTRTPGATPTRTPSADPPATPSAEPSATASTPAFDLGNLPLDELTGLLGQVQACSSAMGAVAQTQADAATAIATASATLAAQAQQASEQLSAAQAQMQSAAQRAAEEAIAAAQAQLQAELAQQLGGGVTDATIANDRARLLQARQKLASAEADLAAATLVSPIDGTVGALSFTTGESSAGATATIIGTGAAKVTVQVPLSVRALVGSGVEGTVGQLAADPTLKGRVTTVNVLPSAATGTPTYATTVVANDPESTLASGSYAEVTLDLGNSADVLTVPMSAVTATTDTTGTVEVVDRARASEATTVTVVTGRRGEGRIEIVSGLTEGQLVVLADNRLPVPGGLEQYNTRTAGPTASPTPR